MPDDWMHILIELPQAEGAALLAFLRGELEFVEIDWCELQRPDRARVSYGPGERPTSSGYTVDPFLPDLAHVLASEVTDPQPLPSVPEDVVRSLIAKRRAQQQGVVPCFICDQRHWATDDCNAPSQPGLCRHCGDATEVEDDPSPTLCAMCQKAGRTSDD